MLGDNPTLSMVTPWYTTYCSNASRPCVISEAGAAFHANSSSGAGVGQLAIEKNWWSQALTNASFFEQFPLVKMVQLFEFEKAETDDSVGDLRDYRITYNATLRSAFLADLESSVPDLYDWSTYQIVYDGNDGTNEPVATAAASYPHGYTVTTPAAAAATETAAAAVAPTSQAAAKASTAAGTKSTSPSLFGAGARTGGGGGAWVAAAVAAAVALGAGAIW